MQNPIGIEKADFYASGDTARTRFATSTDPKEGNLFIKIDFLGATRSKKPAQGKKIRVRRRKRGTRLESHPLVPGLRLTKVGRTFWAVVPTEALKADVSPSLSFLHRIKTNGKCVTTLSCLVYLDLWKRRRENRQNSMFIGVGNPAPQIDRAKFFRFEPKRHFTVAFLIFQRKNNTPFPFIRPIRVFCRHDFLKHPLSINRIPLVYISDPFRTATKGRNAIRILNRRGCTKYIIGAL